MSSSCALPPEGTVRDCFHRWRRSGLGEKINDALRRRVRKAEGRDEEPSAGISDSQSAKGTRTSGLKGYDAGHKPDARPARQVVSAAWADSGAGPAAVGASTSRDCAHLQRQLALARVLDQLGLTARRRGSGPQRRCAGPLHRGDARGRTFSVHLAAGVLPCFDKKCGPKGDVIDRWANVKGRSLREAALDLVRTLGLEPAPRDATEKRNG